MPTGSFHPSWTQPLEIRGVRLPNRLVMAPMSGVSTLSARLIARDAGAGLVMTETLSARAFLAGRGGAPAKIATVPQEDRLAVQLFGSEPEILAEACGRLAERGFTWIDLNAGCPVPKFIRQGAGAALLRDPARLARIVAAMRARFEGVLSVKLRAGWDAASRNAPVVARQVVDEGADLISIHGRTRAQQYRGRADRVLIREVVRAVPEVPVLANGDVVAPADVAALVLQSGAAGVMIGRGAIGNPWIFEAALAWGGPRELAPPDPATRLRTLERHVELVARAARGPEARVRELRRYAAAYSRGLPGGKQFRIRAMAAREPEALVALARDFLSDAAAREAA